MELVFNQVQNRWEAEFEANADFNLHIDGVLEGNISVFQRGTASGQYALVRKAKPNPTLNVNVYDYDFSSLVYPKFIKVSCATEPTYAEVVSDGEIKELSFQTKTVEVKKNGTTTISPDKGFTALNSVKVKVNVPTEGGGTSGELERNDVNFFDYDGTLLYAYSWEEAKNLTELPALPVHDGLEVREWNYTLEDIKAQGVEGFMTEYDTCRYAGDVIVNGTKYMAYNEAGKLDDGEYGDDWAYLLTKEPEAGDFVIGGNYYYDTKEWEIWTNDDDSYYKESITALVSTIGKADVGACVYEDGEQVTTDHVIIIPRGEEHLYYIDAYQFLSVLSIPNTIVSADGPAISYDYIIGEVKIPISLRASSSDNYSIIYQCSLSSIHVNGAIVNLDGYAYRCYYRDMFRTPSGTTGVCFIGHSEVSSYYKISPSINRINEMTFKYYEYHTMAVIDFSEHTFVPSLGYANIGYKKLALIIVPDELYDEWVNTTNWSELAFMIQPVSECEAFIRK